MHRTQPADVPWQRLAPGLAGFGLDRGMPEEMGGVAVRKPHQLRSVSCLYPGAARWHCVRCEKYFVRNRGPIPVSRLNGAKSERKGLAVGPSPDTTERHSETVCNCVHFIAAVSGYRRGSF